MKLYTICNESRSKPAKLFIVSILELFLLFGGLQQNQHLLWSHCTVWATSPLSKKSLSKQGHQSSSSSSTSSPSSSSSSYINKRRIIKRASQQKRETHADRASSIVSYPLDLSYLYHLDSSDVATSLRRQLSILPEATKKVDDDQKIFNDKKVRDESVILYDIDISNSMLRDAGFKEVVDALFTIPIGTIDENEDDDKEIHVARSATTTNSRRYHSSPTFINLKARMNGITQLGVVHLLNRIITHDTQTMNHSTSTMSDFVAQIEIAPKTTNVQNLLINKLDLSFNQMVSTNYDNNHNNNKNLDQQFRTFLEQVISDLDKCPSELVLDRCYIQPSHCRSIAKGLISRYEQLYTEHYQKKKQKIFSEQHEINNTADGVVSPLSPSILSPSVRSSSSIVLRLCGNKDIGDSGCAALAAAVRTIAVFKHDESVKEKTKEEEDDEEQQLLQTQEPLDVFIKRLDLSACDVGDLGAQALAVALEEFAPFTSNTSSTSNETFNNNNNNVPIIGQLDLCYNRISDNGALWLGKAIQQLGDCNGLVCLDLSGNRGITDRGIQSLLVAIRYGAIQHLILRSCSIGPDGTEQVGKAIRSYILSPDERTSGKEIYIDLSGNHLGLLGSKEKKDSSLTSIATSKAASYMNTGMNFLKKAGLVFPSTVESDDEEEKFADSDENGADTTYEDDNTVDPTIRRCAIKALSNAFTNALSSNHLRNEQSVSNIPRKVKIGLRHTFCDSAGADALAAMIVAAKEMNPNVQLEFDMNLNPILEDSAINALHGYDVYTLQDMADRHNGIMQQVRENRERAVEAARLAKARAEAQSVLDGFSMKNGYYQPSDDEDNSDNEDMNDNDEDDDDDDRFY